MTGILLYAFLAILLLTATFWFFRSGKPTLSEAEFEVRQSAAEQLESSNLSLAERIFDVRDRDWLQNELCFPEAASVLARHRKELAVQWLKNLRNSFKELTRAPEHSAQAASAASDLASWELLWLTLRFHFLVNYALAVVSLFGPYHRMLPVLGPVRSVRRLRSLKTDLKQAGAGRLL